MFQILPFPPSFRFEIFGETMHRSWTQRITRICQQVEESREISENEG